MARYGYTQNRVMLDGSSANSSTRTTAAFLIADAGQIALSYLTNLTSVSTITVRISNDDGLSPGAPAVTTWSTLSRIGTQGIYQITPGPRWISVVRDAIDSQASLVLNYRVT